MFKNRKINKMLISLKQFLNSKYPGVYSIISEVLIKLLLLSFKWKNIESVFTDAYFYHKIWSNDESCSGVGSSLEETSVIRPEIVILLKEINAKTLLDAPCGDFNWMKEVILTVERYIGVDIVPELITQNQQKNNDKNQEFTVLDITKDNLPKVDIILCRDCLIHFSFNDIFCTIKNFKKSLSKYLLTTTYPGFSLNKNIATGDFRPINLQLPPFNFPKPIKLIKEKRKRALGLWKLEDILLEIK